MTYFLFASLLCAAAPLVHSQPTSGPYADIVLIPLTLATPRSCGFRSPPTFVPCSQIKHTRD